MPFDKGFVVVLSSGHFRFYGGKLGSTWRVKGLSKSVISGVIRTRKGVLIGVMVPIPLENDYLLSFPTLGNHLCLRCLGYNGIEWYRSLGFRASGGPKPLNP